MTNFAAESDRENFNSVRHINFFLFFPKFSRDSPKVILKTNFMRYPTLFVCLCFWSSVLKLCSPLPAVAYLDLELSFGGGGAPHHPKFFGGQFLGGKIFIAENAFLDDLGWDIQFFPKKFKT